jgi:SAM-dependent methyltransferase
MIQKIKNILFHINSEGISKVVKTKAYDYVVRLKLLFMGFNFEKTAGEKIRKIHDSINNDAHENMPSSYYDIKQVLKQIPMPLHEISMLDIGCGSGRVVAFGMLCKLKAIYGVDLEDDAIKIADENCKLLFNKGYKVPYKVTTADATIFQIPDGVNVLYIFNPFGATTMQRCIENIVKYGEKTTEPLYILYRLAAFREQFDEHPKFTRLYEEMHYSKKYYSLCVYKFKK